MDGPWKVVLGLKCFEGSINGKSFRKSITCRRNELWLYRGFQ